MPYGVASDGEQMAEPDEEANHEPKETDSAPEIRRYTVSQEFSSKENRRALYAMLGLVEEHTNDLSRAIGHLNVALRLSDTRAEKAQLRARIRGLERRAEITRVNAGRRPVLQDSIEQTVRVRPRQMLASARVQP